MVDRQQIIGILNETRRAKGLPDYTAAEIALMDEVLREQDLGVEIDDSEAEPTQTASATPLTAAAAPVDASGWAIPGYTPGGPARPAPVTPPMAPGAQSSPISESSPPSQSSPAAQPAPAPQRAEPPRPADEPDGYLPAPHPAFAAHFSADLYRDPGDEFAPFGSDEASDSVAELLEMRRRIVATTNLRPLVAVALEEEPASVFENLDLEEEHVNAIIVGVGFLLLHLTGRIDDEGRRQLVAALERQEQAYGEHTENFRTMLADLRGFAS